MILYQIIDIHCHHLYVYNIQNTYGILYYYECIELSNNMK